MKEYEWFVNGQRIVISNNDDFVIPPENLKELGLELSKENPRGSFDFEMPLNPLYKRQQETGIPKRVHLSYLCNFN